MNCSTASLCELYCGLIAHSLRALRVVTFADPEPRDSLESPFELWSVSGKRGTIVIWGSAPGQELPGEAGASQKLAALSEFIEQFGPLENADLGGIELTRDIHAQVLFDLDTSPAPSSHLQSLLDQGRTGMADGAGFREWRTDDLERTKARVSDHLQKLEAILPD